MITVSEDVIDREVAECRAMDAKFPITGVDRTSVVIALADERNRLRAENAALLATLEHSATHKALAAMAAENAKLREQLAAKVGPLASEPTPAIGGHPESAVVLVTQVEEKPTDPSPPDAGPETTVTGGGDGGHRTHRLKTDETPPKRCPHDVPITMGCWTCTQPPPWTIPAGYRLADGWRQTGGPLSCDVCRKSFTDGLIKKKTLEFACADHAAAMGALVPVEATSVACGVSASAGQKIEHGADCERTTHPNSLHPCDCGADEDPSRWSKPPERAQPACPSSQCLMCTGEACNKCGAGSWNNDPSRAKCEHDVLERHEKPAPSEPGKATKKPTNAPSIAERNFQPVVSGVRVPSKEEIEAGYLRDHGRAESAKGFLVCPCDSCQGNVYCSRCLRHTNFAADLEARLAAAEKARDAFASAMYEEMAGHTVALKRAETVERERDEFSSLLKDPDAGGHCGNAWEEACDFGSLNGPCWRHRAAAALAGARRT